MVTGSILGTGRHCAACGNIRNLSPGGDTSLLLASPHFLEELPPMSLLLLLHGHFSVSRQAQDGLLHISGVQKVQGNCAFCPNQKGDAINVLKQR